MTLTRRELLRDAALPAALAVLGALELLSLRPDGWGYGVALEVLGCTLLVFRRVNPLVFATLAPTVLLVMPWLGPQLDEPSVPILVWAVSIYSLARWVKDLRGLSQSLTDFSDRLNEQGVGGALSEPKLPDYKPRNGR